MRFAPFVVFGLLAACKGEPFRPDAGPPKDAYEWPWFHPAPHQITNWDIQLAAPYDFTMTRQMYVVEIWDVVPAAMSIDYGDGDPVAVPAGSQAGQIAALRATGATVICHVGTGAIKLTDPDARKFPGFEATPPNRPDAPAAGSVIGWSTTDTDANERFLDIHQSTRPLFENLVFKRIELAKTIGCDGIAANKNDAVAYQGPADLGHGFSMIPAAEHTAWNVAVAKAGHDLLISVGNRGGHAIAGLDALVDDFDWLIPERCTEIPDCDATKIFIDDTRAVFALDYDITYEGDPYSHAAVCSRWSDVQIDGVVKTAALDGSFRDACP